MLRTGSHRSSSACFEAFRLYATSLHTRYKTNDKFRKGSTSPLCLVSRTPSPASPDVGHCDDSAQVAHEHGATDAEDGRDGDVEAAITVHQHRVRPVHLDVLKKQTQDRLACTDETASTCTVFMYMYMYEHVVMYMFMI